MSNNFGTENLLLPIANSRAPDKLVDGSLYILSEGLKDRVCLSMCRGMDGDRLGMMTIQIGEYNRRGRLVQGMAYRFSHVVDLGFDQCSSVGAGENSLLPHLGRDFPPHLRGTSARNSDTDYQMPDMRYPDLTYKDDIPLLPVKHAFDVRKPYRQWLEALASQLAAKPGDERPLGRYPLVVLYQLGAYNNAGRLYDSREYGFFYFIDHELEFLTKTVQINEPEWTPERMDELGPDAEYEMLYLTPRLRQLFGLPAELSPVRPGSFVNSLSGLQYV